jgi:hypothetical protein
VRPPACVGVESAYLSAECLSALRDLCRALPTEAACRAQAPFPELEVICTWARVIRFSDPAACVVEAEEGRCDGGWTFPEDGPFCGIWTGFIAERELVKIDTCDGPVGPWDVIGSQPSQVEGPCLDNVTPPAPAICHCLPVTSDGGSAADVGDDHNG